MICLLRHITKFKDLKIHVIYATGKKFPNIGKYKNRTIYQRLLLKKNSGNNMTRKTVFAD